MKRTDEQEFANEFDADLYRLMLRAERWSGKGSAWGRVVILLRELRPTVRSRMHDEDRRATI